MKKERRTRRINCSNPEIIKRKEIKKMIKSYKRVQVNEENTRRTRIEECTKVERSKKINN